MKNLTHLKYMNWLNGFIVTVFLSLAIITAMFVMPKISNADGALLTSQMGLGSSGSEVTKLQTFLATNSNIYPAGIVSGYYGPLTQAAVAQFQAHYGLPQVGRVGPLTLAKINGVISSGNGLDVSAPVIIGPSTQNSGGSTNVMWSTDSNASGKVFYSTTPLQMTESTSAFAVPVINGSIVASTGSGTSQNVTLPSLASNTVYYYVIMATDAAGNVSVTNQSSFKTN